jgi:hypothetical protein
MPVSKSNFIRMFKHHWAGFNVHKEFLRDTIYQASETLTDHDIDKINISLKNMKEQFEELENYVSENTTLLRER